jgi:hypothetical protein
MVRFTISDELVVGRHYSHKLTPGGVRPRMPPRRGEERENSSFPAPKVIGVGSIPRLRISVSDFAKQPAALH